MHPRDPDAAAQALSKLRARVDAHFAAAFARTPNAFACRAGCDGCCAPRFSVFEIEASRIRAALAQLDRTDPARRARVRGQASSSAHCPLLVDGRCSVYEERPIICRTHGLPVLAGDPNRPGAVDHCPLNFTDSGHDPPLASILNLDAVNRPLAVMATLWDGVGARTELAALARGSDD